MTKDELVVVGAKTRLAEVEKERMALLEIVRGRAVERPTKANGRWRMTEARKANLARMHAGRKKAWEAWREMKAVARAEKVEEALGVGVSLERLTEGN